MSPQPSRAPSPTARTRTCALYVEPLSSSRARSCCRACQQHAFRVRHAAPLPALTEDRQALRDCNTFCRALGLGGACLDRDALILRVELVGEEVLPLR